MVETGFQPSPAGPQSQAFSLPDNAASQPDGLTGVCWGVNKDSVYYYADKLYPAILSPAFFKDSRRE